MGRNEADSGIPAEQRNGGADLFCPEDGGSEMLQEEELPVILDETFAFYDDKRLQSVLKWLSQQERQVIILSCQRREMEFLRRC